MAWREWAPLEYLLSRIPSHLNRGLLEQNITCLAAHHRYLAFGTTSGLVYWYDRQKDVLKSFQCFEGSAASAAKLVETVDIMLAVGSYEGELAIFQIPREVEGVAAAATIGSADVIQHFNIRRVHNRTVTCLAWAVNGQKLFSGDVSGNVFCSTVDYFQHQTTTQHVLKENTRIVQVDYKQKVLFVSTLEESLVVSFGGGGQVSRTKVGEKPRKCSGPFSGLLWQETEGRAGLRSVSVRPDNRLWIADLAGSVRKTVILKSALVRSHTQMPLFNPANIAADQELSQFEKIELLEAGQGSGSQLAVVWNPSCLHVLDLVQGLVVASCHSLRRILDLAVCGAEIFVLETGRTAIRLAQSEDACLANIDWRNQSTAAQAGSSSGLESSVESVTRRLPTFAGLSQMSLSSPLKLRLPQINASSKLQSLSSMFGINNDAQTIHMSDRSSSPAEEVFEAGANDEAGLEKKEPDDHYKEVMDKIGSLEFDDNITEVKVPKKKKKKEKQVTEDKEEDLLSTPTRDDLSLFLVRRESEEILQTSLSGLKLEMNTSPEEEEIPLVESNELLNDKDCNKDEVCEEIKTESLAENLCSSENTVVSSTDLDNKASETSQPSSIISVARYSLDLKDSLDSGSVMPYGPPSDSSTATVSVASGGSHSETKVTVLSDVKQTLKVERTEMSGGWAKYDLPAPCGNVEVTSQYLMVCDTRESVYYSPLPNDADQSLQWSKTGYMASKLAADPSGRLVWRLHRHAGYALLQPQASRPVGLRWVMLGDNVADLAVGEANGWILKLDGTIQVHVDVGPSSPYNLRPRDVTSSQFVVSISTLGDRLFGLTKDGNVLVASVDHGNWDSPQLAWTNLCGPNNVSSVVQDERYLWASTSSSLYFSVDWSVSEQPRWFKVQVEGMEASCETARQNYAGILSPSLCKPSVAASGGLAWWLPPLSQSIYVGCRSVQGYSWSQLFFPNMSATSRLKEVCGGGVSNYSGLLFASQYSLQPSSDLLYSHLHDCQLRPLVLPPGETVQDLAVTPRAMWLLTARGNIFIREGMDEGGSPAGVSWAQLDMSQLANVRLVSLQLGGQSVWAVADNGDVYNRLGSLEPPKGHSFPVWVKIDKSFDNECALPERSELVKIVCCNDNIVWALDSSHGVYVREAVYPELPLGTGWVSVTGVPAVSLAASSKAVWALSPSGSIFRRTGISSVNWVGDSWQSIPVPGGKAVSLTVSECDIAWCLDRAGQLYQLATADHRHLDRQDSVGEDWTLV